MKRSVSALMPVNVTSTWGSPTRLPLLAPARRKTTCQVFAQLILFFMIISSTARVAGAEEPLTLQGLIREALDNNPSLKAYQERVDAARFREPQSGTLPDPMVRLGYVNEGFDRFSLGERPMSRVELGVSQTLPYPGKLDLRETISRADTTGFQYALEDRRRRISSDVTILYYDLYRLQSTHRLFDKKLAYLEALEEASLSFYSLGKRGISDVLNAQTEKYRTLEKLEKLRQNSAVTESKLSKVLGRTEGRPFPDIPDQKPTAFSYSRADLWEKIVRESYELKLLQTKIDASRLNIRLKEKDFYPDVTVGLSYQPRFGSDAIRDLWSVSVGFSLPIFYKHRQEPALAESKKRESEFLSEMEEVELKLKQELAANYTVIESSGKIMSLYMDALIEKAKQSLESAVTSYKNNLSDLDQVIRTVNSVIDYESLYVEQFAEREKAIANILAITGGATQ